MRITPKAKAVRTIFTDLSMDYVCESLNINIFSCSWILFSFCICVEQQNRKSFYGVFGTLDGFVFTENGLFWLVFSLRANLESVERMQLENEENLSIVVVLLMVG